MKQSFELSAGEISHRISEWTRQIFHGNGIEIELPTILADVSRIAGGDRCCVFQANGNPETFHLLCEWSEPGIDRLADQLPEFDHQGLTVLGHRILQSEVISLSTFDNLPSKARKERALFSKLGTHSLFMAPLFTREEVIGFLGVESIGKERRWEPSVSSLLCSLAGIVSAALEEQATESLEGATAKTGDKLGTNIPIDGIVDATSSGVIVFDSEELNVSYLNPAAKQLIGLEESAPIGDLSLDRFMSKSILKKHHEEIFSDCVREGIWKGETVIHRLENESAIPISEILVQIPSPASANGYGFGLIMRDLREEQRYVQKISDSERLLRTMVETAPHALYLLDYKTSRMVIGEENFARMTGYTVEELRSFENGVYEPVFEEDLPKIKEQEKRLAKSKGNEVVPVSFRFTRKDGNWDWIEVHSKVFERNSQGEPISEIGMAQIITDRRLTEERLRRSDERVEAATRGANDGLWDMDLRTGKAWWSQQVYDLLKLDPINTRVGFDEFFAMVHPEDAKMVEAVLVDHLDHEKDFDIEFRMRLGDGNFRWFRGRAEAEWDENGKPIRLAGSIRDVHRRKHAEAQLTSESEFNRVILETMNGFAMVIDSDGRIVRWNRAALKLTEFSEKELSGAIIWDLLFPKGSRQRKEFIREIDRIKKGRCDFRGMRKLWKKGGSTRTVQYHASGIYEENGNFRHAIFAGFDLSEHQRLQREVIRVSEMEQLRIGADLHDGLGQSLTGVSDLSEALANRLREPTHRELAAKIYLEVRSAISEVRRMSHGLTPASIENFGLSGSLKKLAESVEEQSRLKCFVEIEELAEVRDIEMVTNLFRIAQEAVNNAVKHANAERIWIKLIESESEVILRVEDDGIGIDSKTNPDSEPGVGLTVMDYRVGLMGGELIAKNRPGGGTRIEVRLMVDFDRLDRLKSGKVFIYKSAFNQIRRDDSQAINPNQRNAAPSNTAR